LFRLLFGVDGIRGGWPTSDERGYRFVRIFSWAKGRWMISVKLWVRVMEMVMMNLA